MPGYLKNLNEVNKLNPKISKESTVSILLSYELMDDDTFNEKKLIKAFKIYTKFSQ